LRTPSDYGYDDREFILPPLIEQEHIVESRTLAEGQLLAMPAVGLKEQREERRRTIAERCEKMADMVNNTGEPAIVWCHLNDEGDLLEKLIPDAIQVSGRDDDDKKERKLLDFAQNNVRVMVIKPKIGAWGLNYQHCNHVLTFPSHSYEQYYQSVRRCWRFGQKRPVTVDIIATEGEREVIKNLQRKAEQADKMFANLVAEMNESLNIERTINFTKQENIPSWLSSIK
jgi:hypothetical protein